MDVNNSSSGSTVAMVHMEFSWLDYVVFVIMISLSGLIGIYFGCFGTKQSTSGEYLLGGRSMHVFPISMSLIASAISGISVLAVPADIYKYGAGYIWSVVPIVVSTLACIYVYMPVFVKLELVSTYQYLLMRFGSRIKTMGSFIYTVQLIMYNPIVIYLPCLAFSQATGYNIDFFAPATSAFCVFYTAIGGLKAVVWTDTLQTISILLGIISVLAIGLFQSGGLLSVLKIAARGERLNVMNFDIDPTVRDDFWAFMLGGSSVWIVDVAINQTTLQRLRAVSTYSKAKLVMVIFAVFSTIIKVMVTITGLAIYARYADCDPLQSGEVLYMDQMLPYYVMDVGRAVSGLSGLFVAGVFAAALSTLSTSLINLSATIYTDFLSAYMPPTVSERTVSYVLKLIVVIVGMLGTALVFVVGKFGGILQFSMSILGITYGTLLGLFTLGMVFPIANRHGAFFGAVASLAFSSCMVFGNLWYKYKGLLPDYPKPLLTAGCANNETISKFHNYIPEELPPGFFRISFWFYTFYGCLVAVIVGLLVSWVTSKNNPDVKPELISPVFHFLLPKEKLTKSASYKSISDSTALKPVKQPVKQDY